MYNFIIYVRRKFRLGFIFQKMYNFLILFGINYDKNDYDKDLPLNIILYYIVPRF